MTTVSIILIHYIFENFINIFFAIKTKGFNIFIVLLMILSPLYMLKVIPNLYNLEKDYLYIFVDILFIEIASNIPKVIATLVIYKCRFKILSLFNKRIKSILSINPSTYLRGFKVPFIIFFLLSFIFFILQTDISGFGFVNALFNPKINYL